MIAFRLEKIMYREIHNNVLRVNSFLIFPFHVRNFYFEPKSYFQKLFSFICSMRNVTFITYSCFEILIKYLEFDDFIMKCKLYHIEATITTIITRKYVT